MKFVKNTWYVAAWSEEVTRALFHRTLLKESVLLYRKEDGTAVAMSNLCPHRFAPLHIGTLIGDEVECLYHGLRFDCSGVCTDNPHGDGAIPKAAVVRTFPLEERYGLLWIWMGDRALADATKIPDFSCLSTPEEYTQVHGTLHIKANYQLVMDNLTDLSHASFVHEKTLEPRETARAKFHMQETGGQVFTKQFAQGIDAPPLWNLVKGITGKVDHWLEMRFDPPGCMITYYGITECGAPREDGFNTLNPNLITPETESSTHYFWATCRNFDLEDKELTEKFRIGASHAFEMEDKPVLEAQQVALGATDMMSLKPVFLINDAGSVRARRVIDNLLSQETQT
jgi:phenylpropionate dioxygenase-like ring-hydroxylating dioxygenase large terminal subunit